MTLRLDAALLVTAFAAVTVSSSALAQRECSCTADATDPCCTTWSRPKYIITLDLPIRRASSAAAPSADAGAPRPDASVVSAAPVAPAQPAEPAPTAAQAPPPDALESVPLPAPALPEPWTLIPFLPLPPLTDDDAIPAAKTFYEQLVAVDARVLAKRAELDALPLDADASAKERELATIIEEQKRLEQQVSRSMGADALESPLGWLFIGEVRRRVAERAYYNLVARFESCTGTACGTRPRLVLHQAIEAFEHATELAAGGPLMYDALMRMGEAYARTGRGQEARSLLASLIGAPEARSMAPRARAALAEISRLANDARGATTAYNALRNEAGYEGYVSYGLASLEANQPPRATSYDVVTSAIGRPLPRRARLALVDLAAAILVGRSDWVARAAARTQEPQKALITIRLAERAWGANKQRESVALIQPHMARLDSARRQIWDARVRAQAVSGAAPRGRNQPSAPAAVPAPIGSSVAASSPATGRGVLPWVRALIERCAAADTSRSAADVRLSLRVDRRTTWARPTIRAEVSSAQAGLTQCLSSPTGPSDPPATRVEIEVTARVHHE